MSEKAMCVVGAGTMGHGIAQVAALAGYTVTIADVDPDALEQATARIAANLARGVELGKVATADRDAALARVSVSTDLAAAADGVAICVEAVPEKLELKRSIFETVAAVAAPGALLATNTSSLSVAAIAEGSSRAADIVGMHFFNPVHIMKLVEVVSHPGADDAQVEHAAALARELGKTPIIVRDSPGFASSRLGLVLGLEAMRMLEAEVASTADIDTAMRLGYGHPMGPLELTDLVGLDVRLAIADYLAGAVGPVFAAPQILRDKVAAGQLGRKTGAGFYRWEGKKKL
jgi:3-hydroxybutyryl-CoA dehydrogenase